MLGSWLVQTLTELSVTSFTCCTQKYILLSTLMFKLQQAKTNDVKSMGSEGLFIAKGNTAGMSFRRPDSFF